MISYPLIYTIHVTCVAISGTFFLLRGLWMLLESPILQSTFVRIAPHAIDTVLLLSAIALTTMIHQYPFTDHWLTVKLVLLVVYILLGTFALKRGKTKRVRSISFGLAILVFGYMISVAYYHHPLGILVMYSDSQNITR